ncbi:acyltransferase [Pseudomonas sp. LB-090624]|uniref:acyltransferase n=1 Tax=Pseudomonas sp. LB-090624 TaxID=2213079 RepID=UPI001C46BBCE|nr:acyltransferase [Pseudomonas sp. LB-090624]
MNGRMFFQRFSGVTNFISTILSGLPSPLTNIMLDLVSPFSGKISVLIRYCLIAKKLEGCGKNLYIGRGVALKSIGKIVVGDNVSIHESCYIDAVGGLRIGSNVSIAHQTSILTFNHTWADPNLPIKYNPIELSPVEIDDDVWIGCGVRVMPGIVIGKRAVVAAGSVVTRDVPPATVVAGVPAKVIKRLV